MARVVRLNEQEFKGLLSDLIKISIWFSFSKFVDFSSGSEKFIFSKAAKSLAHPKIDNQSALSILCSKSRTSPFIGLSSIKPISVKDLAISFGFL